MNERGELYELQERDSQEATAESSLLPLFAQKENEKLARNPAEMPGFSVLGVRVHAVQIPEVVAWMENVILGQLCRPICIGHRHAWHNGGPARSDVQTHFK